jgi:hypothetical protein
MRVVEGVRPLDVLGVEELRVGVLEEGIAELLSDEVGAGVAQNRQRHQQRDDGQDVQRALGGEDACNNQQRVAGQQRDERARLQEDDDAKRPLAVALNDPAGIPEQPDELVKERIRLGCCGNGIGEQRHEASSGRQSMLRL